MHSVIRSNKGLETMPYFLAFSAFVLFMSAVLVFSFLQDWQKMMDNSKARNEAIKLRNAINEIHAMGDVGSIEKINLQIPSGYIISIDYMDKGMGVLEEALQTENSMIYVYLKDSNGYTLAGKFQAEMKIDEVKANKKSSLPGQIFCEAGKPAQLVIIYDPDGKVTQSDGDYQIIVK
ncbi:MAG: hypothetical protein JW724_02995 [Candidatus Altiarchaeota archaeon]|nr:hypothetical protein [Candidatus Altiarchaeota archaeon]